ncbi:hypothetical protein [Rubellicoccus peritrichatus]|uniref:Uncharacterized protein n=1 Tax=Rubellicoccus peritrichatus TaxID=3080537 RepID=A0AAQ3LCX0_9BACT|nr:hypothetical protein [Puniceicoccus sp. CR14]WOO39649.1 hypothetical protein RZN69_13580 [Puniceicoccus sp. CR14]
MWAEKYAPPQSNIPSDTVELLYRYIEQVDKKVGQLEYSLRAINDLHEAFANDVFENIGIYTSGANGHLVPFRRLVPVDIFLSTNSTSEIKEIEDAIKEYMTELGMPIVYEFSGSPGSWWRRFVAKTEDTLTSKEVTERLERAEHAIELRHSHKIQSEIDKNKGEALSKLILSLENTDEAAILIGSLLLTKTKDGNGKTAIVSRNLTSREVFLIERTPDLLGSPQTLLKKLDLIKDSEGKQIDFDASAEAL